MSHPTPMRAHGTCVYLPDNTGGFDLRGCPNAEELAEFIVRACNEYQPMLDQLAAAGDVVRRLEMQRDELVKALEMQIEGSAELTYQEMRDFGNAILAKVKGN